MNATSWWLLALVLICMIGLLIRFNRRNKQLARSHREWMRIYAEEITTHQQQIHSRRVQLSAYDFEKYNLKEVLLPNAQIVI